MVNIPDYQLRLLIFDGQFPKTGIKGFRAIEFEGYLSQLKNSYIVTIPSNLKNDDYHVGRDQDIYLQEKKSYLKFFPQYKEKFLNFDSNHNFTADLIYSLFLNETFAILDIIEKNKIPFVFCLYPGGGFFVDNKQSDEKLKRIFKSPCFRKVLVTQEYTKDYLLQKKLCDNSKIHLKYGGFVQFEKKDVLPRKYYPNDKETFDICFVAFRYVKYGLNKGYDLFIETAKILHKKHANIRFHVVGNWDKNEIDVSFLGNSIIFYGAQNQDFLLKFYSEIDIFLTPNRPFYFGSQFDGFPLGIDAGFCGVPIFTSDELNMNHNYIPNKEIVIIPLNSIKIANIIEKYYINPSELISIGLLGQNKMHTLFNTENQLEARINLFDYVVRTSNQFNESTIADNLFIFKFNIKRSSIHLVKRIYRIFKSMRFKLSMQNLD